MSDDTRPRIEVTIAAPVDVVWDALRDREKIRHWFGWDYDGLDGEIDLIFFTETVEDASTRTLRLHGGDAISLEPHGEGTRVTLTRVLRGDNPALDAYYEDVTEGWITFMHQLRFAVERRPGAVRRTLSFVGGNDDAVHLIDALDLAHIAAGTPFQVNLVGEDVKGEMWYRSDHQLGITVDAWGNGLLIVSSMAPTPDKPKGAAMAILSTYHLDDTHLADLDSRWRAWWTERFPGGE
ncbi:SRPBCC family protein [Streptomyces durhamensis]|uniref:SRPBCC family protein n=1 Tax=Streptomyces durhamensis TaxID=68194 RepID=UPI0004CD9D66|nr:SRPBCC domain-containing protein [Streptomyces durhamensis]